MCSFIRMAVGVFFGRLVTTKMLYLHPVETVWCPAEVVNRLPCRCLRACRRASPRSASTCALVTTDHTLAKSRFSLPGTTHHCQNIIQCFGRRDYCRSPCGAHLLSSTVCNLRTSHQTRPRRKHQRATLMYVDERSVAGRHYVVCY